MNLLSTSLLSAVAVGVKAVCLLATNKILAIYVGPSGYALIGQFQNALTAAITVASAGVTTGVTKFTAEYDADSPRQQAMWATAGFIGVIGATTIAAALVIFREPIAAGLLRDRSYADLVLWSAFCLPLAVLNALLLAVLNGKKAIRAFVAANIANSLVSLAVVGGLATWLGLRGALIALALGQAMSCLLTLWLCARQPWFKLGALLGRPDHRAVNGLLQFTVMAAATSVLGPLSQMLARDGLIDRVGGVPAGHWEALMRLSSLYLMFVTTPLSVYYLPRLAELTDKVALRREVREGYQLLLPVAAGLALVIFLLRDWIVTLLFTHEFAPMRELFLWQMVGDVLRVAAWLLSFYLLGKAMTKPFLAAEVTFSLSFVFLVDLFTSSLGIGGAPIAYAVNNALYLGFLAAIVRRDLV